MLTATNLHKSYRRDKVVVPVLRGLDFEVQPGEFLSVVGASGSGKSTLLHLLGTLDRPDSGEIQLDGQRIDNLAQRERDGCATRPSASSSSSTTCCPSSRRSKTC